MYYSPPGSSVHGTVQARILEWAAFSFSRGSSGPRDQTDVSCIADRFFTFWATREPHASIIFLISWFVFTIITQFFSNRLLSPLHLFVLVSYYLAPFVWNTFVISLCQTYWWSPVCTLQDHCSPCFWCLHPGEWGWFRSCVLVSLSTWWLWGLIGVVIKVCPRY